MVARRVARVPRVVTREIGVVRVLGVVARLHGMVARAVAIVLMLVARAVALRLLGSLGVCYGTWDGC